MKPTIFTLQIDTSNAAFNPDSENEVIRILKETIKKLESDGLELDEYRTNLRDYNGNTVGTYGLEVDLT